MSGPGGEAAILAIESVLDPPAGRPDPGGGTILGRSREGRPVVGHRFGSGPLPVSLIAGCHADEPVGPALLDRLAAYLAALPAGSPLLTRFTWCVVPHVNPDGEARNAVWTAAAGDASGWARRDPPAVFDLARYLRGAVREAPGDDVEFGFPRGPDDVLARPENRAVAAFLAAAAPLALHGSLHGMGFARGPWFLLERAWIDRTAGLRDELRARVAELGYRVHDVDRGGEKGFDRIDQGFTTRPDSRAMARHFEERGDRAQAALFRPSSMELARSLGGDPLTLVSEMPLFLLPEEEGDAGRASRATGRTPLVERLRWLSARGDEAALAREGSAVRPMPIRDQMAIQLAYVDAALRAVDGAAAGSSGDTAGW